MENLCSVCNNRAFYTAYKLVSGRQAMSLIINRYIVVFHESLCSQGFLLYAIKKSLVIDAKPPLHTTLAMWKNAHDLYSKYQIIEVKLIKIVLVFILIMACSFRLYQDSGHGLVILPFSFVCYWGGELFAISDPLKFHKTVWVYNPHTTRKITIWYPLLTIWWQNVKISFHPKCVNFCICAFLLPL